jgi:hypothetical protein
VSTSALSRPVDDVAFVGGGLSLLAGTMHGGLAPDHFGHAVWLGAGFVLAAVLQTAWTLAALRGVGERLVAAGLLVNLGCVAAWLVSRTVGLPGLTVEPAGVLDVLTVGVELSLCGVLLGMARAQTAGLIFACSLVCVYASGMATHA